MLEYAGDDRLYVPTEQLDRLGSYVAATDEQPTLTRLGGNEWQRIKERGQRRSTRNRGGVTPPLRHARIRGRPSLWAGRDLATRPGRLLPYVETPDQMRAIDEVKGDMEVSRPMDRLICGDVGYGKTEVALRAAFKAVNEGMQVAVLVPTTVLAQQHYATFAERLAPYPVKVDVLEQVPHPQGAGRRGRCRQDRRCRYRHRYSPHLAEGRCLQQPGTRDRGTKNTGSAWPTKSG